MRAYITMVLFYENTDVIIVVVGKCVQGQFSVNLIKHLRNTKAQKYPPNPNWGHILNVFNQKNSCASLI